MNDVLTTATRLTDRQLTGRLGELARKERQATAELVAHLTEFDGRRLYLGLGHGSLFSYCTAVLRLAEHAAFNRIEAARLVRRFPVVLDRLADGAVTLATLRLIGPLLTDGNHRELLERIRGRSKREVALVVAALRPQPDVPATIRKLPTARAAHAETPSVRVPHDRALPAVSRVLDAPQPTPEVLPSARAVVAPLAPERYRLQLRWIRRRTTRSAGSRT